MMSKALREEIERNNRMDKLGRVFVASVMVVFGFFGCLAMGVIVLRVLVPEFSSYIGLVAGLIAFTIAVSLVWESTSKWVKG